MTDFGCLVPFPTAFRSSPCCALFAGFRTISVPQFENAYENLLKFVSDHDQATEKDGALSCQKVTGLCTSQPETTHLDSDVPPLT